MADVIPVRRFGSSVVHLALTKDAELVPARMFETDYPAVVSPVDTLCFLTLRGDLVRMNDDVCISCGRCIRAEARLDVMSRG